MENSVIGEKNLLNENEDVLEAQSNDESICNENPIQKKRGRKRKNEQVKNESFNNESQLTDENTETRSSRRRKSVNYFALANPDISNNYDLDFSSELNKSKEKNLKKSKTLKSESKSKNESSIIQEDQKTELDVHESENEPETDTKSDENQIIESEKSSHQSDDENSDDLDFQVGKVYRRTGNTKEMVNTLLSQVEFQKFEDVDENNDLEKGRSSKNRKSSKTRVEDGNIDDKNQVTCAICKKEMEKVHWIHHKQRYHNNLAWRIGDKPLDLTNLEFVKQTLNALYNAKKQFYCERCDKAVKSVNGFLSHKSICGKNTESVKISCKLCDKKMLPVSLPSHIRTYHEGKKKVVTKVTPMRKDDRLSNSKRKAAEKALEVIQNNLSSGANNSAQNHYEGIHFLLSKNDVLGILENQILESKKSNCKYPNCDYESLSAEDVLEHATSCVYKPENGFVCKHCLFVGLTFSDIVSHIENVHGYEVELESSNSEKMDPDDSSMNIDEKKKKSRKKLLWEKKNPYFVPSNRRSELIFEKAYEWTLELCRKNYSAPMANEFFSCLKSNWELMPVDTVEEYLPRIGYSCDVGFETVIGFQDVLQKDHTFRKFHLFESYLENNGNSTIFCGGPITALSWSPVPYTQSGLHQVVAVATKNHPDTKYTNDVNYNEKCVIQFWDIGPLKNLDTSMYRPRLGFCLSFEHGPVWDLKWCPSNCYDLTEPLEIDEKFRRLGVLAVAGSDSAVYIYSIPNLKPCGQFYNSRPVLKLVQAVVQEATLGNKQYYATRISWTKAPGHKYIAVGYSNGMVSIYNVTSTSILLLRKDENDVNTLLPIKSFQAHLHYISAIYLHHLNNGCRWLLTGSYDRAVSLWDLKETSSPIQNVRKNIVNDVTWLNNWLCYVIAYDEASTTSHACSTVQQVRDFLSEPLYIFHCSAAITCLTGSDWLNSIIQANAVGEIFATFPKQLMINLTGKNMKTKKLLFGFTTLIEKDKTIEERLLENVEKEKALKNKLKVKTVIKEDELPTNKEVTHLDYNPHYYEYEPLVYHEVASKYGLLFCDHKMNSYQDFPSKMQEDLSFSSKKFGSSKPNIYPLQSINKIELNPNRQATTYYVTGYQAGFVRFTCMKFLNKDPQIVADNIQLNK